MAQLNTQPVRVSGPTLTLLENSSDIPVRAEGQDAALAQLGPLSRLIQTAGGRLDVTRLRHGETAPRSGAGEGCWLRLYSEVTPLTAGESSAGKSAFSCYPVRGLRGILSAKNSSLSLSIVGVPSDVTSETLRAAAAFAAPGISNPAVGVDSKLLAASGLDHNSIHRWTGAGEAADLGHYQGQHLNVESIDTGLSAAQLSHGEAPLGLDVMVVPSEQAAQLARQAAAVSGTRGLRVKAVVDRRGISASVLPYAWVNQPQMDPSGSILAAVSLLLGTGQRDAAQRLHNGWLATVEAGFHTAAFKHIAPYTWRVSADEFFQAVQAHLGERPHRLTPARYSKHLPSGRRAALKLVR